MKPNILILKDDNPVIWRKSTDGTRLIGHMLLRRPQSSESNYYNSGNEKDNGMWRKSSTLPNDQLPASSSNIYSSLGLKLETSSNFQQKQHGPVIAFVEPDSVADSAGRLQAGDEIIEINGNSLQFLRSLEIENLMNQLKYAEKLELVVERRIIVPQLGTPYHSNDVRELQVKGKLNKDEGNLGNAWTTEITVTEWKSEHPKRLERYDSKLAEVTNEISPTSPTIPLKPEIMGKYSFQDKDYDSSAQNSDLDSLISLSISQVDKKDISCSDLENIIDTQKATFNPTHARIFAIESFGTNGKIQVALK